MMSVVDQELQEVATIATSAGSYSLPLDAGMNLLLHFAEQMREALVGKFLLLNFVGKKLLVMMALLKLDPWIHIKQAWVVAF